MTKEITTNGSTAVNQQITIQYDKSLTTHFINIEGITN